MVQVIITDPVWHDYIQKRVKHGYVFQLAENTLYHILTVEVLSASFYYFGEYRKYYSASQLYLLLSTVKLQTPNLVFPVTLMPIRETGWFTTSLTHWGRDKMAIIAQTTISKCIFLNENKWISINISLKFVPEDPINNISSLVQTMACCRPGDKPLSEPMMLNLLMHICVTRPQWVNEAGQLG